MKKLVLILSAVSVLLFSCKSKNDPDDTTSGSTTSTETNTGDDDNDFVENQTWNSTVSIVWNGSSATVSDLADGVVLTSNSNGYVVLTSTAKHIEYAVSGEGSGQLKIYSDYKYKLSLNGLTLNCTDGPAINNQSSKTCYVVLSSENSLTDGSSYSSSSTDEDQKAAFFSEGQVILSGSGILSVTGNYKHALCSDDYIRVREGSLTLTANASDGLHTNDGIIVDGGTISISAAGDAIQCDTSSIVITGGTVNITKAGDKGILAYSNVDISGGTVTVVSTDKGIKSAAGNVVITGGTITVNTTGDDGKGILAKLGEVQISGSPVINVTTKGSTAKGIKAVGDMTISGGTITVSALGGSSSYAPEWGPGGNGGGPGGNGGGPGGDMGGSSGPEGIESKATITISGGTINIKAVDDAINAGGDLTITGGSVYAYSTGNDAIDSNGNMYLKGGVVIGFGGSGAEAGIDVAERKSLIVSGGEIFGIGGRVDGTFSNCTQSYGYTSNSSNYSGGYIVLSNGSEAIYAVKMPSSSYSGIVLASSSSMSKNSTYTLSVASSVNGTETNGFIAEPTVSSSSKVATFTAR